MWDSQVSGCSSSISSNSQSSCSLQINTGINSSSFCVPFAHSFNSKVTVYIIIVFLVSYRFLSHLCYCIYYSIFDRYLQQVMKNFFKIIFSLSKTNLCGINLSFCVYYYYIYRRNTLPAITYRFVLPQVNFEAISYNGKYPAKMQFCKLEVKTCKKWVKTSVFWGKNPYFWSFASRFPDGIFVIRIGRFRYSGGDRSKTLGTSVDSGVKGTWLFFYICFLYYLYYYNIWLFPRFL